MNMLHNSYDESPISVLRRYQILLFNSYLLPSVLGGQLWNNVPISLSVLSSHVSFKRNLKDDLVRELKTLC